VNALDQIATTGQGESSKRKFLGLISSSDEGINIFAVIVIWSFITILQLGFWGYLLNIHEFKNAIENILHIAGLILSLYALVHGKKP